MASSEADVNDAPILIVAVDYGTTFSGLCWVLSNNLDVPHVVRTWPLADGTETTSDKVPTRITYDAENKPNGWVFMIEGSEPRYQEFKLFLDNSRKSHHAGMAQKFKDPTSLPLAERFTATKLSIDFLRELRNWLEVDVDKVMGAGTFESIPIEWVVTVPAIWSDQAKGTTRWCAEKAGMGDNVKIITEPEAAMVHAIQSISDDECKTGDCFVLCDAGGGTVDLITYKIKSVEPLEVEELVQGDGDRCGSVFLDRQFKAYLERTHARLVPGWTEQHTMVAVGYFERITKRKVEGSDEALIIKVPAVPNYTKNGITIKKGKVYIPAADVRMMFQIVLDIVRKLVLEQHRRAIQKTRARITGVVLVGGFGASEFVRKWLDIAVSWTDNNIKLYQPADGWTAIVRGALSRVLPILSPALAPAVVYSRVSRKFYGITESVAFQPGRDPEDQRFWVDIEQKFYIERIQWFLRKVCLLPGVEATALTVFRVLRSNKATRAVAAMFTPGHNLPLVLANPQSVSGYTLGMEQTTLYLQSTQLPKAWKELRTSTSI
ncbi:hypothetical protein PMZ80_008209 [Knufia obscura]|uniref:Actin-like ATPase domain-containing protein n=1 Tax=Knufia obscura TaxID=1635080 RepID=A0ABR0RGR2_9EURO|nr:hypothetical protein PMZ80_008209 [Knufia obscura]